MMHQFNQTMDYLEEHLTGEVDMKIFHQLSGYSYPLFSRLFSILADMTLAEYLRNRRLSEAVTDLRESSEKVIDIALKYGYESADAFSATLRNSMVQPLRSSKWKTYRAFPRLQLSLKITGGKNMDIKVQKKPAFTVAGVLLEAIDNSQCPSAWEQLYATHSFESLEGLGSGQSFGVCSDVKEGEIINYIAAYDVTDKAKAKNWVYQSKKSQRLNMLSSSQRPNTRKHPSCLKYVLRFFPRNWPSPLRSARLEVYTEGDMSSLDYQMELWIPVIRD